MKSGARSAKKPTRRLSPALRTLFIAIYLVTMTVFAHASEITLTEQFRQFPLNRQLEVFRDTSGTMRVDDVIGCPACFTPLYGEINGGYTHDVYWLKFVVRREPNAPTQWWIEIAPPFIKDLALFVMASKEPGKVQQQLGGTQFPYASRWLDYRNTVFPLNLHDTEPYTIYLRVSSNGLVIARPTIWAPVAFSSAAINETALFGLYYGVWLMVVIGNFVYWIAYRIRYHYWWMLYLLADILQTLAFNGLAFKYLFPGWPTGTQLLPGISLGCALIASSQFLIHAFALQTRHPAICRILRVVPWLALTAMAAIVQGYNVSVAPFLQSGSFLVLTLGLVLAATYVWKGERQYRQYLYAFAVMEVSLFTVLARNLRLIESTPFITYFWQINLLVHVLLTNFGIAQGLMDAKIMTLRAAAELALAKAQQRFVAFISHELKNPLMSLDAIATNLIKSGKTQPLDMQEKLRTMYSTVHRLTMLVGNYLTDAGLKEGNLRANRLPFDFPRFVNHLVMQSPHDQVILKILPGVAPGVVRGDPQLLRIALSNLIDNAVKYSPDDKAVRICVGRCDTTMNITIADSGAGISATDLQQIFDPFYRSSRHGAVSGHGMGLWIVKRIIELHEGAVVICSAENVGTFITISLPCVAQGDGPGPAAATIQRRIVPAQPTPNPSRSDIQSGPIVTRYDGTHCESQVNCSTCTSMTCPRARSCNQNPLSL